MPPQNSSSTLRSTGRRSDQGQFLSTAVTALLPDTATTTAAAPITSQIPNPTLLLHTIGPNTAPPPAFTHRIPSSIASTDLSSLSSFPSLSTLPSLPSLISKARHAIHACIDATIKVREHELGRARAGVARPEKETQQLEGEIEKGRVASSGTAASKGHRVSLIAPVIRSFFVLSWGHSLAVVVEWLDSRQGWLILARLRCRPSCQSLGSSQIASQVYVDRSKEIMPSWHIATAPGL